MSDPRDKLFEKLAIKGLRVRPFDGFIFLGNRNIWLISSLAFTYTIHSLNGNNG